MSERSWTIRPYEKGDETGYLALMKMVFPKYECDLIRWCWEFRDNPFGFLQTFSTSNGKIVGHLGLVGVPIKVGDRILRGSQAVDLAVHPDFRRKGMFLEIGKKLVQCAEDEGIVISYAAPSERIYRGFLKFGWFYVSEIPLLLKIMRKKGFLILVLGKFHDFVKRPSFKSMSESIRTIKNLIKVPNINYRKHALCSDYFVKYTVTSFDERFDKLWEEASRQHQLLVARNAKYLNWRYVKKPHSSYVILLVERNGEVEGYIVLLIKIHRRLAWKEGFIVDVFAKSNKAINCLLQSALNHFAKENVNLVTCWMMKNQLPYYYLIKSGFIVDSLSSPKLVCRINSSSPEFRELYHRVEREWFFTIGDSDIV